MVYFQRFQLFGHFHPTGAVELVPNLPPSLGVWWHPDPHACHQDGRPLQAGLRPPRRLPWPASARLVPDGHASEAGLLPDAVRQAGEAGRREAVVCVHTSVDHVTGSLGGAGSEYFPWEERGLIPGPLENLKVNRSAINRSHIVCEPMMFPERIRPVVTAQEPVFILKITFPLTEIQHKDWNEKAAIKSHIIIHNNQKKREGSTGCIWDYCEDYTGITSHIYFSLTFNCVSYCYISGEFRLRGKGLGTVEMLLNCFRWRCTFSIPEKPDEHFHHLEFSFSLESLFVNCSHLKTNFTCRDWWPKWYIQTGNVNLILCDELSFHRVTVVLCHLLVFHMHHLVFGTLEEWKFSDVK